MSFETWFASYDWYHEESAREAFAKALLTARLGGIPDLATFDLFDDIIEAMRHEYGD